MPHSTAPKAPQTMPVRAPRGSKPFPYQHSTTKPKPSPGSSKDVAKIALDSLLAYFGRPTSYKSVPITAMFSNFGLTGENPDVRARIMGFRSAADHQSELKRFQQTQQLGKKWIPKPRPK